MFLIELFPDETPEQVVAFLDSQVDQIFRLIKIKVKFELCDKYRFQGREFVRVICTSPQMYDRLRKVASKGEGISRDYLHYGTRRNSALKVWWLHRGKETEHEVKEVERIPRPPPRVHRPVSENAGSSPAAPDLPSSPAAPDVPFTS